MWIIFMLETSKTWFYGEYFKLNATIFFYGTVDNIN